MGQGHLKDQDIYYNFYEQVSDRSATILGLGLEEVGQFFINST